MKLIRFDWAVKHILRDKANFVVLEGFLSELLKRKIVIVSILESESNKTSLRDKLNRVDLLCKDADDELIYIEVQNESELDYLQRMSYGAAKLICESLSEGMSYGEIKKVISINIVYFDLGKGRDYIYHGTTHFVGIHYGDELELKRIQQEKFGVERVYELFPEYYIIKTNAFRDELKDTLDEWVYFLKHAEIKDNFTAQGLLEAKNRLDVLQMSESERLLYEDFVHGERSKRSQVETARIEGKAEGIIEGKAEGIIEGEKIGAEKSKLAIARQMLADGLPIEVITKYTGLSAADLKAD
jgi:predicted transposase/invertase (TIGR01784 family)